MFSQIIINSPWYFFLISLAIASALSIWLYYRNSRNSEVPRPAQVGMSVIRFISVFLLCLLLLQIVFKHQNRETENPIILVAIDNSSSMVAGSDSEFVKGTFVQKIAALKKKLAEKYSVKTLLFGASCTLKDKPDFVERETDLSNLIQTINNNYSNQNIGALVIASDGVYNKGANPLYSSEKLGFPIYTIAMGDTNEIRDVQIQKVNYNEVVYAGNNFPIEVLVHARKFAGREVRVSILEQNTEKASQIIKLGSDDFLSTCQFTLNSNAPGLIRYSVMVTVLEEETNHNNNRQSFVVQAIENKEKILVLAGAPHPDLAAIKEALHGNSNYEVEFAYYNEFHKPLNAYGLVILHGHTGSQNDLLKECFGKMIPFWLIHPTPGRTLPGMRFSQASGNQWDDAEPFLNSTFGMFNLSPELVTFVRSLRAVKTPLGFYPLSNGSTALLKQRIGNVETDNPILFFGEQNGLKFSTFIGDGLWKWSMQDFAEHKNHALFNELISKSVQYLVVKSDKSFFRLNSPGILYENQTLEINAEVYNKSYEPITEPEVTLTLKNDEGKKFEYTFSKRNNFFHLNVGLLPPGDYSYEARTKANNELYVKKGLVAVKEVLAEKLNTIANHKVLYQLSQRSGGQLVYPTKMETLGEILTGNEEIKPITYTQTSTSAIIEMKWLFWLIFLLFALEWFIRKRFLTI